MAFSTKFMVLGSVLGMKGHVPLCTISTQEKGHSNKVRHTRLFRPRFQLTLAVCLFAGGRGGAGGEAGWKTVSEGGRGETE